MSRRAAAEANTEALQREGASVSAGQALINDGIRPRIGAGFRLQWEPAQDCHVLLYPEGMVKLNHSAGEILKRCDGERPLSDIVRDLQAAFNARGLTGEVHAFVEMAARQRWLRWD